MQAVFLSCSFRPEDERLRKQTKSMIESHLLRVVEGDQLAGGQLTPAIHLAIEQSDALVAVVARRNPGPNGTFNTSQWVLDELQVARTLRKHTLALWDEGVPVAGMIESHERAVFAPDNTVDALLKLSHSLGRWKELSGYPLRAMLLPVQVAKHARKDDFVCEYRFTRDGVNTDWQRARVTTEPGGAVAFMRTPNARDNVQVRVSLGKRRWLSSACPQQVQIELEE